MPSSAPNQINQIVQLMMIVKPQSLLDIGIGFGKFGFLAREYLELWDRRNKYDDWQRRIDGIEAKGLDENLDLIVDRTPKFGCLARSTPELIVERLAKLAKGQKKDVYLKILENLERARSE